MSIAPPKTPRAHPRLHLLRQWSWALVGLMLGPRSLIDPGAPTYRQLWERVLVLEARLDGLVDLLTDRKLVTETELYERAEMAATDLDQTLRVEHPGAVPTVDGMRYAHGRVPWRRTWTRRAS